MSSASHLPSPAAQPLQNPRSLRIVASHPTAGRIAFVLIGLVAVVLAALVFVPWQQTVIGYGQTIVYNAMDRPQNVEAQISGRIVEWRVQEGQPIKKGEVIVLLRDIDSKFLDAAQVQRLRAQRAANERQQARAMDRVAKLETQLAQAEQSRANTLRIADQRIVQSRERLRAARQARIAAEKNLTIATDVGQGAAGERLRQASNRIRQAEQALRFARQNLETSRIQRDRVSELFREQLRSKRDVELAENDFVKNQTDVERAADALRIAVADRNVSGLDQNRTGIEVERVTADLERARAAEADADAGVASAIYDRGREDNNTAATLASLSASIESARESIAKIEAEQAKIDIDLSNTQERREQQTVVAPRNGRVVRVAKVGEGETVKAGDVLAVVMPDTQDQAVELMVSDNDVPLVSEGRQVRLQLAGWPALQFSGFPSVSVGTFAGRVSVIDAIDDGTARYRIIVKPDYEAIRAGREQAWPKPTQLRPGAEATGWVLLDTVPLGFELWRQFNAFPATVKRAPVGEKESYGGEAKPLKDKDGEKDKGYIPVKAKK